MLFDVRRNHSLGSARGLGRKEVKPLRDHYDSTLCKLKMEGEGLLRKITLNDGHKMPMFGLGVFNFFSEGQALKAAKFALQSGYRMLDTAAYYQ